MKESGCEGVFLGIESGSDRMLKNMNKSVTVEQYLSGIQLLKEYEILVYGSFIIGFPGETDETVQDTIRFIKTGGLDFYRAQVWYCDPITPVWKDRDRYQLKGSSFEWSHGTMDANRAADRVDDIFMSIHDPVWVPQYHFECDTLFHLLHRGLDLDTIKEFLKGFNNGVREKIKDPSRREVSLSCIEQIKKNLGGKNGIEDLPVEAANIVETFDTEFDF
jgi:histone acetyltransferase (RNA polymerase elongator complex component)